MSLFLWCRSLTTYRWSALSRSTMDMIIVMNHKWFPQEVFIYINQHSIHHSYPSFKQFCYHHHYHKPSTVHFNPSLHLYIILSNIDIHKKNKGYKKLKLTFRYNINVMRRYSRIDRWYFFWKLQQKAFFSYLFHGCVNFHLVWIEKLTSKH